MSYTQRTVVLTVCIRHRRKASHMIHELLVGWQFYSLQWPSASLCYIPILTPTNPQLHYPLPLERLTSGPLPRSTESARLLRSIAQRWVISERNAATPVAALGA